MQHNHKMHTKFTTSWCYMIGSFDLLINCHWSHWQSSPLIIWVWKEARSLPTLTPFTTDHPVLTVRTCRGRCCPPVSLRVRALKSVYTLKHSICFIPSSWTRISYKINKCPQYPNNSPHQNPGGERWRSASFPLCIRRLFWEAGFGGK